MNGTNFVKRLDDLLKKNHLTRKAIAEICEISTQSITDWSKRGNLPSADIVYKIAQTLNVSMEYLITGVDLSTSETELKKLKKRLLELGTE